jgi:hypothetical protein
MIRIRELKNLIAHEYATDKMMEIYGVVMALSPALLAIVPKVQTDALALTQRYPS